MTPPATRRRCATVLVESHSCSSRKAVTIAGAADGSSAYRLDRFGTKIVSANVPTNQIAPSANARLSDAVITGRPQAIRCAMTTTIAENVHDRSRYSKALPASAPGANTNWYGPVAVIGVIAVVCARSTR